MCSGTVLEIGANDGMYMMTSLLFSKRGWRTILIEADPRVFAKLTKNRPDAMTIHAIAGQEVRNETWIRFNNPYLSGVDRRLPWEKLSRMIKAGSLVEKSRTVLTAAPLGTLMLQRGVTTIDLLSLDVEGSERAVLETIDFNAITVGVLLIERGKYNGIPAYLRERDVEYVGNILYDAVFVSRKYRESMLKETDGCTTSLAALSQRLTAAISRPSNESEALRVHGQC
jgi:FkbM family methyltransferase